MHEFAAEVNEFVPKFIHVFCFVLRRQRISGPDVRAEGGMWREILAHTALRRSPHASSHFSHFNAIHLQPTVMVGARSGAYSVRDTYC